LVMAVFLYIFVLHARFKIVCKGKAVKNIANGK
jgi:hypothetical protein